MNDVNEPRTSAPAAITVIAPHSSRGYSMRRYAEMLHRGYVAAGIDVELLFPTDRFSRSVNSRPFAKFVAYVEQLILFAWQIRRQVGRNRIIHVADHSDALLLLLIRHRSAIVTCHDLFALLAARGEIPEHRTRWSGRLYQSLVGRGLKAATALYCVSRATENDVRRVFPTSRTRILPNAVNEFWFDKVPGQERVVERPYLLVVSSSGWRKRREHSVAVWSRIAQAYGSPRLRLVMVGPPLDERETLAIPPGQDAWITVVQAVSDVELRRLYSGAVAVLQVSLYEGFGWPIVEANAAGTPAICADLPVFHEVGGEAATFIPADIDAVDGGMILDRVLSDCASKEARRNAARYAEGIFARQLRSFLEEEATVD